MLDSEQTLPDELMLYKMIISLLGNLVINNPLGVIQCQRILVYEEIKTLISKQENFGNNSNINNANQILINQITAVPYAIKKDNLRILYQVYMCSFEKINMHFSIVEVNDILQKVILTDLSNYYKYLDGIMRNVNKRKNEQEKEIH